jgi:hypothetical protein
VSPPNDPLSRVLTITLAGSFILSLIVFGCLPPLKNNHPTIKSKVPNTIYP